jgi:predicted RNA polymerase sigma factor
MTDRLRSEEARRRREELVVTGEPSRPEPGAGHDDTVILMFLCCHPALTPASAIALTLRAVGGLTTAEIATAFLVPEASMAQRISRAKQRIEASAVPFRMPTGSEWASGWPGTIVSTRCASTCSRGWVTWKPRSPNSGLRLPGRRAFPSSTT